MNDHHFSYITKLEKTKKKKKTLQQGFTPGKGGQSPKVSRCNALLPGHSG
jgi:hypothetical protein